jgi:hypothetical protein
MRLESQPEDLVKSNLLQLFFQLKAFADQKVVMYVLETGQGKPLPVLETAVVQMTQWVDAEAQPGISVTLGKNVVHFYLGHEPTPTIWYVDQHTLILSHGLLAGLSPVAALHITVR